MRLLVAEEFAPGRFRRVTIQRCNARGRNFSPGFGSKALHGSMAAAHCIGAARFFAAEPAARTVNYRGIRVDRID